jgi:hypothetical protein
MAQVDAASCRVILADESYFLAQTQSGKMSLLLPLFHQVPQLSPQKIVVQHPLRKSEKLRFLRSP